MALIKQKRIGMYRISKYPKAVWAMKLPDASEIKKFRSMKAAEAYARKKSK